MGASRGRRRRPIRSRVQRRRIARRSAQRRRILKEHPYKNPYNRVRCGAKPGKVDSEVIEKIGSSGRIRTYNPSVNSRTADSRLALQKQDLDAPAVGACISCGESSLIVARGLGAADGVPASRPTTWRPASCWWRQCARTKATSGKPPADIVVWLCWGNWAGASRVTARHSTKPVSL